MSEPISIAIIEIITNYIEQPHADTNNPSG